VEEIGAGYTLAFTRSVTSKKRREKVSELQPRKGKKNKGGYIGRKIACRKGKPRNIGRGRKLIISVSVMGAFVRKEASHGVAQA